MLIGGSVLLALQNGGFRQGREAESLGVAEGTKEESYQDGFAEGHELPGEIDIIVAIDFWQNTSPRRHGEAEPLPKTFDAEEKEETEDWREEKQLQHRGAGEEKPEDAGRGMENLRQKTKKLKISTIEGVGEADQDRCR